MDLNGYSSSFLSNSTDRYLLSGPILWRDVETATMAANYDITETLDVSGENCPMPVVKTRQATDGLGAEDVLEVVATDPGSVSDIAGWADSTGGVELLDQAEGDGEYRHYVRKTEA